MTGSLDMDIQNEPISNYQNVETPHKTPHTNAKNCQHRAFRLAAVCIGVLCVLQGTLNIVLRLYFTSQPYQYTNQSEERDKLQRKLSDLKENINKQGWRYFSSSVYYVSTEKKSWQESRDDCRGRESDLVIISSREEQKFVESIRQGEMIWIGLTDQSQETVWKWVDDSTLTTGFWTKGEPNDLNGNEDCVLTGFDAIESGSVQDILNTWNDHECSDAIFWMCEKNISF